MKILKFEDTEISFTKGRTDGQTDAGRQVIRKAQLSFQLKWAKNERHTIRIKVTYIQYHLNCLKMQPLYIEKLCSDSWLTCTVLLNPYWPPSVLHSESMAMWRFCLNLTALELIGLPVHLYWCFPHYVIPLQKSIQRWSPIENKRMKITYRH